MSNTIRRATGSRRIYRLFVLSPPVKGFQENISLGFRHTEFSSMNRSASFSFVGFSLTFVLRCV